MVWEKTGPLPQVKDIASKELMVKPASQVNETDVDMTNSVQEPVMENAECSNMERHNISVSTTENNDTISASPALPLLSETILPKDQTVTSQPAEAFISSGVEAPAPKAKVQHRKIYREQTYTKELVESSPFKPLTIQQLESLYYNPQLAQNDKFVQEFIQNEISKERHEFYEILMDYFRARMNFLHAEGDIRSLQKNYHGLVESLWHTTEQRVSIPCYCGDNVKCTANHTYSQCSLNEEVLQNISHALQAIRTELHEQFSLHAYSAQLSRFQVESYIHNLFMSCPVLRDIPRNAPVQAMPHEIQDQGTSLQIHRLKECISILFMFHRRPIKDEHFMQDIRSWTERLTSALLRIASFSDHLFILNHILRCPAGVGKWAGKLIQVIPPQCSLQTSFGGPILDHAITILATILLPVAARTEFICQMNIAASANSEDKENMWILVDSDGEEDEDPKNSWQYLHENDIVALLKQFPTAAIFRHIFLMDPEKTNLSAYDVLRTSDSVMMKVFAFSTSFINLLSAGLQTFSMSRYRQLNKRLGRMIRQSVHYVSCHWQNFKTLHHELSPQVIHRLQLEFDQFFLRATHAILTAEKLGSWQFMADMPFIGVSMETMWRLLWILHQSSAPSLDLDRIPVMTTCMEYMKEPDNMAQFADNLVQLPTSESIYLLTTFSNMAQSRCEEERQFVEVIVLEVFEIAYISSHTRDFCSKVGRELLSAMAAAHPFIISIIIQRLKDVLEETGMDDDVSEMCLYLFREMPLYQWQPTKEDMDVLGVWLLESDVSQPQNHLARLILSNLDWGFTRQEDRLSLPVDLHRQLALLLVQAFAKFVADKNAGYAILQGMKQVASAVRNQMTSEQQFSIWVWDLALRLHLHKMSLPSPVLLLDTQSAREREAIPDVENDVTMLPLLKSIKAENSMACFVALAMTKYGHNVSEFTSAGLGIMMTLSSQNQHHAVIKLLSHIVPMFYQTSEYLLENDRFMKIIRQAIAADDTYMKFAKSMIVNMFPGETIKLFADMIQTQVHRGASPVGVGGSVVVVFWVTLLTQVPRWYQDRNCCFLLDNLIKAAFSQKGGIEGVKDIFKDRFQAHLKDHGGHGVVTSFVNWIASSSTLPSFIDRSSSEFGWLAYVVLETEAVFEQNSKLWKTIQHELISDPGVNVDLALKKAATRLKLSAAPAIHRLNIYRWGQQALDMPIDHPLLPVFWQRFFVLYLGRLTAEAGMPQRASIGEKFFESSGNVTMMKKMKKKLSEASEYHLKIVPEAEERSRSFSNTGETEDPDSDLEEFGDRLEETTYVPNCNFHHRLASLYRTFLLWMDEPRLHDASLYLPSLPPQYEASRLQRIFHNQVDPWMDYVDMDKAEYELSQMVSEWVKRSGLRCSYHKLPHINIDHPPQTATEQILQRLTGHDIPDPPPPVAQLKAPVPDVSVQVLEDKQAILYILNADINVLKDYSKVFMSRMSKHMALDVNYLELLPEEYYNQRRQVTLTVECKKTFNPTHKCKRAAVAQAEIQEKTRNEMVQRRIDENRAEFKQVMIEALLPSPPNICMAAVHVENVIVMLVKLCQTCTDQQRVTNLQHIASTLFYHMASMINDETNFYPPTRQFFSSCIEVLGQEFIRYNHDQVYTLLEFALSNPTLAGLLSPHFLPNHSPQYFVNMYEQVSKVPLDQQHEMAFTFLSKFEVASWLEGSKPSHGEVSQYLKILSAALCRCGSKPNTKFSMMLELYCCHLQIVLKYRFPEYLEETLTHLLEGSTTESLSPSCWEAFCEVCLGKKSEGSSLELSPLSEQRLPVQIDHKSLLSITQIQRLLEWLGNYFTRLRTSNQDLATFGLYPKWRLYSWYIGELIRDLVKDLAVKLMVIVVDWTPQRAVEFIWHHMIEAFSPWIQPFDNQPEILTPWVENDSPLAIDIVSMFRQNVEFVQNHFSGTLEPYNCDPLSLLWTYYTEKLSPKGTPDFVLTVYHCDFQKLPWEAMQPCADIVANMAKLKDRSCDDSFLFLSRIFPRVNWSDTLAYHMTSQAPGVTSGLEASLFTLLLQFYSEKELMDTKDGSLAHMFMVAEGFNWSYLVSNNYCEVTNWLLQHCDPACILSERSSIAALGPRLMKYAAGFTVPSSTSWQPDMSVKRVNYIHCLVQLLCQCTFLGHLNTENFSTIIINLLTEIETVEGAVSDSLAQQEESLDMIKEMFSLLNNCNPDGNSTVVVMATFVQWLQSSPNSILLMPCLKASSRSLASLNHMAQISEVCIETYFSSVFDSSDISGWGSVLASLQIPELSLEDYFHEALLTGSYLTLFSYVLQQLPLCQGLQDEEKLILRFTEWLQHAKPSSDNEAKIILWIYKFLTLWIRQVDFGTSQSRCADMLQAIVPSLIHLGEDRSSTGLLGAIGLGRKSALSHKIRVFARSMAAFLATQIPGDGTLRVHPGPVRISSQLARQTLGQLQAIKSSKEYSTYWEHVQFSYNFIMNEANTVQNAVTLLVHLAHSLYPGQGYLMGVQHL
ncbi:ectopic P granules protein 5 homolog [Liolophura sinensis]|uniref:ectopic P granules protein 5 homolog n=1 Tax=Liolophura sinensis TaxID=3198878 RepID=UPI0031587738